jgi:hypothetical protein
MLHDLPLPQLHERVQAMAIPPGDTTEHAAFYRLLASYRTADTPAALARIATACRLRAVRLAGLLPLDLVNAYARLEALARWRAMQLAEDFDARR